MTAPYDDEDGKSRSQKKRESTAAQDMGAALAALPLSVLDGFGLPPDLVRAIAEWKKYTGHEARRRQMQYIGRLMRETDEDAVREKLDAHRAPGRAETAALHRVENLRDNLVNAGGEDLEQALRDLAADWPAAELPRLRHLALTARQEREKKRPPKAYRELFRILKALQEQT